MVELTHKLGWKESYEYVFERSNGGETERLLDKAATGSGQLLVGSPTNHVLLCLT